MAQRTLFYFQAIDQPVNQTRVVLTDEATGTSTAAARDLWRKMLQVPSLTQTKLPAVAYLHVDMRIRILGPLLPPWVVQDSTGSISFIELHPRDKAILQDYHGGMPAEHVLLYPPTAVYVQMDNLNLEFIPPTV